MSWWHNGFISMKCKFRDWSSIPTNTRAHDKNFITTPTWPYLNLVILQPNLLAIPLFITELVTKIMTNQ